LKRPSEKRLLLDFQRLAGNSTCDCSGLGRFQIADSFICKLPVPLDFLVLGTGVVNLLTAVVAVFSQRFDLVLLAQISHAYAGQSRRQGWRHANEL